MHREASCSEGFQLLYDAGIFASRMVKQHRSQDHTDVVQLHPFHGFRRYAAIQQDLVAIAFLFSGKLHDLVVHIQQVALPRKAGIL